MEFSREMTDVTGLLINKKSVTAVSKRSVSKSAQACRVIDLDSCKFQL